MSCWIVHQFLDPFCFWVILSLTRHSGSIRPLRKNTSSRLIAVYDADLESIVVKPSKMSTWAILILFFKNLEKFLVVFEAVLRAMHDLEPIADRSIEALDLARSLVTLL